MTDTAHALERMTSEDRSRRVRALIGWLHNEFTEQVREAVSKFGLTKTQAAIIRELSSPLTQRQIASALKCEPSNVTYVIDRLENQGLVTRTPHPTDRRAKMIELTSQGWEARTGTIQRFEENSPVLHLTAEDLDELEGLLLKAVGPGYCSNVGINSMD